MFTSAGRHFHSVAFWVGVLLGVPAALAQSDAAPAPAVAPAAAPAVQIGAPLLFEGERCVMVPFAADGHFAAGKFAQGAAFYLSDNLSGGFGAPAPLGSALALGSCFDLGPVHWNNLIVSEGESRQSRLMLNRKATIVRCLIPRSEPAHPPEYLVFAIADADTNGDGVIDERDATVLYLSDPLGQRLVAVTPPGGQVGMVTFNAAATALFVQVFSDGEPGGSVLLHVDPAHPGLGTRLWTGELASQALHLVSP